MPPAVRHILQFWFGTLDNNGFAPPQQHRLWFAARREDDARIKSLFGAQVRDALDGRYADWRQTPESALALILLTDQMTRAIGRGQPQAFAGDAIALPACHDGLAKDYPARLPPHYQMFYYMPLQHSENLDDQKLALALFQTLHERAAAVGQNLQAALDSAIQHHDIIARFGRFPHRNRILNRQSSDEEEEFLRTNRQNFGQK